ncbi:YfhE family protein [Peribacillus sp. SCS-155]
MEHKKKDKTTRTLTSTQEVLYNREFRNADRAGGYVDKRSRQ